MELLFLTSPKLSLRNRIGTGASSFPPACGALLGLIEMLAVRDISLPCK